MSFVPAGTKVESGGGDYFKPPMGSSEIRILGDAETGYEYWTNDKKAVRLREMPTHTPPDLGCNEAGTPNPIRQFWAIPVWDYSDKKVKVWGLTQATIMTQILKLSEKKGWGHPKEYDLTIDREGSGLQTKYSVTPSPKTEAPPEALKALADSPIDLSKQFQLPRQLVTAGMSVEELDDIPFD